MSLSKPIYIFLLLAVLFWGFQGGVNALQKGNEGRVIKASGCVKPGVESGCLIVTAFEDEKKVYNIFIASRKKTRYRQCNLF
jgi:hypothetical protein